MDPLNRIRSCVAALTASLALLGCGGGGSQPRASLTAVKNGLQSTATVEAAGSNCPCGGARIDSGIDGDNNGVLDASECNQRADGRGHERSMGSCASGMPTRRPS